ncbi:hypothetical protein C2845_PM11G06200 [Panicum miliaceum]|uniref:Uncharacterized protein n=1 Tax=Panicum miliaceum TaxID=4540 RepID=A0A3L6RX64_PANMI|nr:hypothetical protein C2845_PM11G06200 [Panicum miliaceum]
MIETFIHEEYVNKRREQRRQNQQPQQRRRRPMRALQIETGKGKLKLPASSAGAAESQQSPRDQHQPAAAYKSPVGSPTAADAASFRDHLFDYLKPY